MLPLSVFQGKWYGPALQQGRILQRLTQTHQVILVDDADLGAKTLVATKVGGGGVPGEFLWRLQGKTIGMTCGGASLPAAVYLTGIASEPTSVAAEVLAISKDKLHLHVQGETCVYHRVGAVGLERVFLDLPSSATGLRRMLLDYSTPEAPALLPAATPIVDVSYIWRASGALVAAVVPPSDAAPDVLPSSELLTAIRDLHIGVGAESAPRLVFVWPGSAEQPDEVKSLADAKAALGLQAELYSDESGQIISRLAHEVGSTAPGIVILVVASSGAWRGLRSKGGSPGREQIANIQLYLKDLLR